MFDGTSWSAEGMLPSADAEACSVGLAWRYFANARFSLSWDFLSSLAMNTSLSLYVERRGWGWNTLFQNWWKVLRRVDCQTWLRKCNAQFLWEWEDDVSKWEKIIEISQRDSWKTWIKLAVTTDMSRVGVVLADGELWVVLCLFFLKVVLMVSVCFLFMNFCTKGALWLIRGFSVIGQYLIGLPLALISEGDVSINCKGDNSTSIGKSW